MTMATLEDYFIFTETVVENKIDWLVDKIQPWVIFQMPDGGEIEFPLGIFYLSTPTRNDQNGNIYREVEAYDGLIVLDQDKFLDRYTIKKGTSYEKAVRDILKSAGITKINIEFAGNLNLTNDKEFDLGTSKLAAVNELLDMTNNTPLWVDAYGYYITTPYRPPSSKSFDYTYDDRELSIIMEDVEEEFDIYDVANTWVITASNPESPPLVAKRVNNSPDSPTSTVNRRRTIVDFREIEDISSQAALDGMADRIAFEASQVYGKVKFETPIMPFHEYYDSIKFVYTPLGIDAVFSESNWEITLEAGATMKHEARRVIDI
ncbi:hypothetical protein LEO2_29 [Bacillus phage Leo2]|uniref:Uncharacterized protein n=2 Tax=Andromedavirus TaxID=1623275 RepID=A0A1S5QTP0_9CAUD|nr:hypothetical protein FDG68_gp28 [Bacillus phage Taylor]AGE60946.1 hypothetical protein TAYLOR_28 [Bacillus phage Taylor]AMR60068.1 hypothetical protein LEO2_29 [Bacillus phage Leo2]